MAQVINTNTMSLNAQRNLSTSGSSLATTIQRLSSGLRINSAKDDAAGLAISERFTTQIRGLDVAIRNANDGISLAQVAEGSLNEVGNNLQRIRELGVQASNATNSASDRKALQAEVTQLVSEIDRVAKQADFNGTKLLDGSFTSQLFQVGANAGQAIAINSVVNAKADSLGAATFANGYTGTALAVDKATADTTYSGLQVSVTPPGGTATTVTISDFTVKAGESITSATAAAINNKLGETGVVASVNAGVVSLASVKDGQTFALGVSAATPPAGATAATLAGLGLTETSTNGGTLTGAAASFVKDLNVTTAEGAQKAMSIVDKALESVNSVRADLGAIQNRFTSVVANLQTSSENLSASRSRIRDTDFAKETAELTRTQILQQAGTAMLAHQRQLAGYHHPAPVLRFAHQQRQGRRRRPGDLRTLRHPDPRYRRRHPQCQRRHLAGPGRRRFADRNRQQPAARPRAVGAGLQRHQLGQRPQGAAGRSDPAGLGNRPRRQAVGLQRHQAAGRFVLQPAVPGRCQRRPGHRHRQDHRCQGQRPGRRQVRHQRAGPGRPGHQR